MTRIYFLNGDKIEGSPNTQKKVITFTGTIKKALLTVVFPGKFGWQLNKVDFNGKVLLLPFANPFDVNQVYSLQAVNVADAIRSGENTLTLSYAALPFDSNRATAYLDFETTGIVTQLPNVSETLANFWDGLKNAGWQVILILALIALIGFFAFRLIGGFL